jgi:hypothetical protein
MRATTSLSVHSKARRSMASRTSPLNLAGLVSDRSSTHAPSDCP